MYIYIHTLVTCMIHKYMCVYMYNLSEYMVECLIYLNKNTITLPIQCMNVGT